MTYQTDLQNERGQLREQVKQLTQECDVLAEALAAVLGLADEWTAEGPYGTGLLNSDETARKLRAAVAAPVAAAPQHVAARLEAYGHLARLRAEVEAAQRTAEPLTVAQAAREVASSYAMIGDAPIALGITQAFERFANLLEGK